MTRLGDALERARAGGNTQERDPFPPERDPFPLEKDPDRPASADPLDSWTSERQGKPPVGREPQQGGNGARRPITRSQDPAPSLVPTLRAPDGPAVPFDPALAGKLVISPSADGILIEECRRLAAALHHAQLQGGVRTVMVTSAVEAEGKTLTAANLALTLSHSYQRRVLLIDADLRRPSIHLVFQLENHVGLGGILKHGATEGSLPVQQVLPLLWVMTAGKPDPDPISGLVSDTMRQVISQAAEHFDWVVIDTPPVGTLPDANLLSEMIDGAVLVVGAHATPHPMVTRAVEAIGASRILGVVLNRVKPADVRARLGYYGYYGHYGYTRQVPSPAKKRWGWFRFRSS